MRRVESGAGDVSVLARSEILREIKAKRVKIEPLRPNCVRAASIDMHLANAFRVFQSPHKVIPVTDLTDFKRATRGIRVARGSGIQLSPGETVLGITEEKVTLPDNICGWLEGRSRFSRVGLLVHISASFVQPGIANHQVLELSNFGPSPLEIFPGTAVCQLILQKTLGTGHYRGLFEDQTPEAFSRN
jgi:dCTP deaminase